MDKGRLINKGVLIKKMNEHFFDKDPDGEIHKELKSLIENGYNRDHIKKIVEDYLGECQNAKDEKGEDIMSDVYSFFVGWSHPDWQL